MYTLEAWEVIGNLKVEQSGAGRLCIQWCKTKFLSGWVWVNICWLGGLLGIVLGVDFSLELLNYLIILMNISYLAFLCGQLAGKQICLMYLNWQAICRLCHAVLKLFLMWCMLCASFQLQMAAEWFCFADTLDAVIGLSQNYTLMRYLPYMSVAFHLMFATNHPHRIMYPQAQFEVRCCWENCATSQSLCSNTCSLHGSIDDEMLVWTSVIYFA